MGNWVELLGYALIAVIAAPFLLLGLLVAGTYLNIPIADRLIDPLYYALNFLWIVGAAANIVVGLAIAAAGIWLSLRAPNILGGLSSLLLVPFGLWRVYRGVSVAWGFRKADEAP